MKNNEKENKPWKRNCIFSKGLHSLFVWWVFVLYSKSNEYQNIVQHSFSQRKAHALCDSIYFESKVPVLYLSVPIDRFSRDWTLNQNDLAVQGRQQGNDSHRQCFKLQIIERLFLWLNNCETKQGFMYFGQKQIYLFRYI